MEYTRQRDVGGANSQTVVSLVIEVNKFTSAIQDATEHDEFVERYDIATRFVGG